jgi:methionyl-tRNA formyltransferase
LRLVFMGSPEPAVPVLDLLFANGHQVLAVYTPPDRPAGRGRNMQASPVRLAALALGLPAIQVSSLKQTETLNQLAGFQADAIIVAAFGYLLPPAVLDMCPFGCLNIHPSLLPQYRGASPVTAAILSGENFAGVSIIRLDPGLDSGPLVAQSQVSISDLDTTGNLTERLFQVGGRMLLEVLAELTRGKLEPVPQDSGGVSYSSEIDKEAGKIDWGLTAREIWRRVRAYQPWPGAYTLWRGRQLKIIEAEPVTSAESIEKGLALTSPGQDPKTATLAIATGQGILKITRLQIEGKRIMSGEEFLRGYKEILGSKLG